MMNYSLAIMLLLAAVLVSMLSGTVRADITVPRAGFEVKTHPDMTVDEVKEIVSGKLGVQPANLKLTLNGNELEEPRKLEEYNLKGGASIDYKQLNNKAGEGNEDEATTVSTTTRASYFGVNADDEEAVKQKQRELSEEKFRELFGDEAHFEINLHHDEQKGDGPHTHKIGVGETLKWMMDVVKRGLGHRDEPATTTTQAPASQ